MRFRKSFSEVDDRNCSNLDMELVLMALCAPTAIDVRVVRSKLLFVGMIEIVFGDILSSENP